MTSISSIEDVKTTNRQIILRYLRKEDLISRTRLAKDTGLSKATVTRILGDMLNEGLVEEVRTTESGVGRPHVLLRLAPRARYAVGVELSSSMIRITLTDMKARPLKQRLQPVYNQDVDSILEELADEVEKICKDLPANQVVGVGVTVPGSVDITTGMVNMEYPAGWQDIPLAARLKQRLGLPIMAINEAHAAAWGEKWHGAGGQVSDLMYIRLGTIVEAGLVIDDNLHYGKTFTAGAIGHMVADSAGELCVCGNRGCLNTVAGTHAVLARARSLLKDNKTSLLMGMVEGNPALLTMDHLMRAVQAGDGLAVQTLIEIGEVLGVFVANLFNLLNLEKVVIGGPLSMAGNVLLSPLREMAYKTALPAAMVIGRIEMTRLGIDSASIGAASLVLQELMGTQELA